MLVSVGQSVALGSWKLEAISEGFESLSRLSEDVYQLLPILPKFPIMVQCIGALL